jgi:hypothetical protein
VHLIFSILLKVVLSVVPGRTVDKIRLWTEDKIRWCEKIQFIDYYELI